MYTLLTIILFCIVLSAFFSATETAFTTCNRIKIKGLAEKGNKKAITVLKLSDNFDTLISTILIGNNIVNILSASLATVFFTRLFLDIDKINDDMSATISTIVMTIVVLVFGEITPKSIVKHIPEKYCMFAAPLINALTIIFKPLTYIFKLWQNLLAKMFKDEDEQGITEEDLISIIEEAEEEGDLGEDESTLIKSAIEFNELEVGDIFTPRIDITAIESSATKDEVAEVFSESGYSRLPIYENDLDNVMGIVYYKDFFTTAHKTDVPIADIIKPVMYVTKTQKISDVLKDLQEKQLHMAIVTDEYGSTAGIVTLEDILEEIVGEIWDEHDEIVEEIKKVSDNEYIVSGMANLDKLFDELDLTTEEESDITTVNGWAMDKLGGIPEEGEAFSAYGLSVTVLKMDGRRIENLQIIDQRENEAESEVSTEEDAED